MKEKIDDAIQDADKDHQNDDSDLDELIEKKETAEVSALDSLIFEGADHKGNGIYLQELREKMIIEKSEFKLDDRAHN